MFHLQQCGSYDGSLLPIVKKAAISDSAADARIFLIRLHRM